MRTGGGDHATATSKLQAKLKKDPRRTRGLFVDPLMPGANQGAYYKSRIGSHAQPLWIIPEAYGTSAGQPLRARIHLARTEGEEDADADDLRDPRA